MQRIFAAAAEEFKRCGYSDATTASIARNSGVTEAQLFRYFSSKAKLFRETVFKPLDGHLARFLDNYDPPEIGFLYSTDLQRFISDNVGMFTSLVVAETYKSADTLGVGAIDSLRDYFARGAATMRRAIGPGNEAVDPRLIVRVSFVAVLASVMFKSWIFPPGLATDEEITDAINRFVMHGIKAAEVHED